MFILTFFHQCERDMESIACPTFKISVGQIKLTDNEPQFLFIFDKLDI